MRLGDWEIRRFGDWDIGRLGDWEIGRLGDGADWGIGGLGQFFFFDIFVFFCPFLTVLTVFDSI